MTFTQTDYTNEITNLIFNRQHKTTIEGIEIILPKQPYNSGMTTKQRLRDAREKAKKINELLN